jgi:flagellar protein FlbD
MDGPLTLRMETMIVVTRLNGPRVALNSDLIERAEATPDTVLTLVDGTKYVVQESVEEVIDEVRNFRASIIALAQRIDMSDRDGAVLRLVHPEEA